MSPDRSLYHSEMGQEFISKFRDNPTEGSIITVRGKSYVVKKSRWVRHRPPCVGIVVSVKTRVISGFRTKEESKTISVLKSFSCPGCESCGYLWEKFKYVFPQDILGFNVASQGKYRIQVENLRKNLGSPPDFDLTLEAFNG